MSSKKGQGGWMAIKIDLQKAFDRLRWGFIADTLVDAGIPQYLICIILHCITSSTLQVQWNGVLSRPFQPQKGIRQGDPISPYLFNLTMERLSHLISHYVSSGQWKAFKLVRNGSPISHLFFVDDLILYAKADIANAEIIDSILSTFGSHSGHLNDEWNWPLLQHILHPDILPYVQGVVPPNPNHGPDYCSEVPKLLSSTLTSSLYSLVRAIARLMSRAWSIDFQVIKREANSVAYHLAKLSLGSGNHKLVMDSPPTSLVPLLSRDVHGPPYARTARTIPAQAAQDP
ncbi:hypothetical protein GQ457_16G012140 [Hibiscus cannabinus]